MRKILLTLILLLIVTTGFTQCEPEKRLFQRGDITSYSLSLADGVLDGFNQGLYHYPGESDFFNPYNDGWELDADHLSEGMRVIVIGVNIGLSLDDFKKGDSFWRIPKRIIGTILIHQVGFTLTHKLMKK